MRVTAPCLCLFSFWVGGGAFLRQWELQAGKAVRKKAETLQERVEGMKTQLVLRVCRFSFLSSFILGYVWCGS